MSTDGPAWQAVLQCNTGRQRPPYRAAKPAVVVPTGSTRRPSLSADRKMCVVVPHILARGPAARPRCIPPAIGSLRALNPFLSQETVSPVNHSRETSLSLHPSTWRAFLPPRPLTISWRRLHRDQEREHIVAALPMDPSHRPKGVSHPLEPRPTLRGLDAASVSTLNPIRGLSCPLNPSTPAPNHGHFEPRRVCRRRVVFSYAAIGSVSRAA